LKDISIYKDKELFSLIAQGDEAAFEKLFTAYVPSISNIIYRVVKSETNTKDIVQEVFLQLWLGRDKLPEIEDPSLWIFRITYNCSFRYIKRQLLQEKTKANIGIEQAMSSSSYETEEMLNFREAERLIHRAITQLPAQSRKIYELNRTSGMKPHEIAEQLGINIQSVRNSLTRSTKFIKDYLAQHGIIIPLVLLSMEIILESLSIF
jgi:RNA polymerase sigma-70 factor (ECF subfamily)